MCGLDCLNSVFFLVVWDRDVLEAGPKVELFHGEKEFALLEEERGICEYEDSPKKRALTTVGSNIAGFSTQLGSLVYYNLFRAVFTPQSSDITKG